MPIQSENGFTRPQRLKEGDRIAITAPAMYNLDAEQTAFGIKTLENLGFTVVVGETVNRRYLNTTGTIAFRKREIENFFEDKSIDAIICLIGGNNCFRLLDAINYDVVRDNPKIFSGMSDITHLQLAFLTKAKLMGLHGLDLFWGFGVPDDDLAKKYNIDLFVKCCMSNEPLGRIPHLSTWETWRDGIANAPIIGGWFGALKNMRKSLFYPSMAEYILFTEFVDIEPHKVQRELANMKSSGFFCNVKGILVGQIVDCEEKKYPGKIPSIREMIVEIADEYNLPVIGNVDFGHGDTNIPLPEGIIVEMDASNIDAKVLESFVV